MDPEQDKSENEASALHQQWVLAGGILIYSLSFFVVILWRQMFTTFTSCHPCNPFVQTTQYVRGEYAFEIAICEGDSVDFDEGDY